MYIVKSLLIAAICSTSAFQFNKRRIRFTHFYSIPLISNTFTKDIQLLQ